MAAVKGSISIDETKVYEVDGDPSASFTGATPANGDMALQKDGTNGNAYLYDAGAWKRLGASGEIDLYNGTTRSQTGIRVYCGAGTTDSNGRLTLYTTNNGLVGGTALFSSILSVQAIGFDGSGNPLQAPLCFVEAQTGSTFTIRAVRGVSQGILIGGVINTLQYCGAGYTIKVLVVGLK